VLSGNEVAVKGGGFMKYFFPKWVLLGLLPLLLGTLSNTYSDEIINGIACKVGSSIITINEFNTAYVQSTMRARIVGLPIPGKPEVLDKLIEELLIREEAELRGLVVSEAELNSVIDNIKKQSNISDEEFNLQLEREKITLDELKGSYRMEILKSRLVNLITQGSSYKLDEEEIRAFYDNPANRKLFMTPATVSISQIYIPITEDLSYQDAMEIKKRVNQITEEARNSSNFEELVMMHSQAANKEENRGNLGSFTQDQLLSFMKPGDVNLVFALDPGDVTSPIRLPDGYYIFKINERKERSMLSFDDAYENIRSYLFKLKGEETFREWLLKERGATKILIVMDME
jgi:peptidyl-prolyl cis-trans isomerase SurA